MLEDNFVTSMIKADGNVLAFFSRPIAAGARRADDRDLALAAGQAAASSRCRYGRTVTVPVMYGCTEQT